MAKKPIMRCGNCGYMGSRDMFRASLEYSHDVVCPTCGSTLIDTSKFHRKNPRYIYGDNNTIKFLGVPK